jgi:hypothetical protein
MWNARNEIVTDAGLLKVAIDLDGAPVSYAEILRHWQHNETFRSYFLALLADAPFAAFRWETPPITTASAGRPFEFVVLNSPGLARNPDADAFAEHFKDRAGAEVVEFPNLGSDAILVVPCPTGPLAAYGHLGAFVRQAPERQRHALWQRVGAAMQRRVGSQPVWLSTAGAGVPWLHVRLDDRPKYYAYQPYQDLAQPGAPATRPRKAGQ